MAQKHVAVLMGGWSAEREVSLNTGKGCALALESVGYKVTPVDVQPDIGRVIQAVKPDVAFNALHGRYGEDGTIQGLLEILRIPYTHSGVLASALAMHKERAKMVLAAAGVPVPQGVVVHRLAAAHEHAPPPGARAARLALRKPSACGILHFRPRADLRCHGRQGPRRNRHPARHGRVL